MTALLMLITLPVLVSSCGNAERHADTQAQPAKKTTITNSDKPVETKVVINGRTLTSDELRQLEVMYQTKAVPGNYWYDGRNGLFGVVGQSAAGFMYPGHDFGPLAADASMGDTGVFINGREQTTQEVQMLSYLAMAPVQPGRYWLDAQGNVGYEGNPYAVGNLFLAAQQRAMSGGGGGDNFWTSRFSAGNYNADNSAGYVSLPGGGSVSYGF